MNNYLVHHVFFWLKEPTNTEHRKQFEKAINKLIAVEVIQKYHIGIPASTLQRDVVDHSYTYSFLLFFNSKTDQDVYQAHPLHIEFVEASKHLWEKVIVYDSVDL